MKSTSCNFCHQVGHDKFECPVLFASTFNQAMPGHSMEGVKMPQYWHEENPQNGPAKSVAWAGLSRRGARHSSCPEGML